MSEHQDNLSGIKSFLRNTTLAWKDSPIAAYNQLILDQGKSFLEVVSSDSMEVAKGWRKRRRPKMKECFYNAQMFVVGETGEYYEGYCFDGLLPFHHAWVVMDGKVIDFTLEARDRSLKRQKIEKTSSDPAYLGVFVPKQAIIANIVKTGVAEPLAQKHYLKSEARFL